MTNMAIQMELSRILIRENHPSHIIELREMEGTRKFAIEIGRYEAAAIERRLSGRPISRPQTHDLLASIIQEMGGAIQKVIVNDLVHDDQGNGTFLARLMISLNGKTLDIDSRPSDAIALGIANNVPIFVASHVLEEVGREDG